MSLLQPKFFGLTVRDFKASLGYGSQVGQLAVQLVADPAAGDAPAPVSVGYPCYFQFYGFRFWGLLQKFAEARSLDGLPAYEAVLTDPREVLEGAQLVLGDYAGPVGGVYNLFNCYGWWEAQGFGASGATRAGMPWDKALAALLAVCNTPAYGPFGGPLTHRGVAYALDLTEVPTPPPYYRLPGPNMGLLDVVTQICEDAACDFFVELVGTTIRVRTVTRNAQPPLGTISAALSSASFSGAVARAEFGVEGRNEVTSTFLVGGRKTTVQLVADPASFWGYDLAGNPVVGTPATHPDIGACEAMTLNATGVADIIGSTGYATTTVEIRAALKDQAAWLAYVKKYRADIAPLVHGLFGAPALPGGKPVLFGIDLVNDKNEEVVLAADRQVVARANRLYNWLRGMAEAYYGTHFLVRLPLTLASTDPDTLQVTYSQEPAEAGYLPGGAASLGVSALNLYILEDQDERVFPFAYFPDTLGAEAGRLAGADMAVENGRAYVRASVEQKVVFLPGVVPVPCAVVTLSGALYDMATDVYGGAAQPVVQPGVLAAGPLAAVGGVAALEAVDRRPAGGTVGALGIHPAARYPTVVGVPLRSNTQTYGPWFVAGLPGKVRFEADESLTPWEYGGEAAMEQAALARVISGVSAGQYLETGSLTVAGAPNSSPGDVLAAGGPNVTNIDVQFGPQGVTSTYRFQTFTPRFGVFSRQNADRIRRMSVAAVETRRNLRSALRRAFVARDAAAAAFRGATANLPLYAKKTSPHTVLVAETADDGEDYRTMVATETLEAVLAGGCLTGDNAAGVAVMGWSGLLRPFTAVNGGEAGLPGYVTPASGVGGVTVEDLNPFADGHDIEILSSRLGYAGVRTRASPADPATVRAVGLRGPVVVVGWGPGLAGGTVGEAGDPSTWKAGPVDHVWDDQRGVWTSHDLVTCTTPSGENLPAAGSAECWVGGASGFPLTVHNPFRQAVPSGTTIIAGYCLNESRWNVIAADCPASG